jgi:N-dimethylarginine dimethylaminohydrolase
MFYPIRQQEVILAEIGLRALGINHENMKIQYGSIEGGDVMPIEINGQRYAFIGRAERTSDGGVERWFQTHEDLWNQMHLDTFFQQVGKDSCIHCDKLTSRRRISVLTRRGSEIVKVDTTKFNEWIEKKFTNPYIMTREEQLHYAPNILVDAGSTVYITRNDSPEVTKFIKEQVPEIVLLDLQYLTKLYGGVHCSTSEIRKL